MENVVKHNKYNMYNNTNITMGLRAEDKHIFIRDNNWVKLCSAGVWGDQRYRPGNIYSFGTRFYYLYCVQRWIVVDILTLTISQRDKDEGSGVTQDNTSQQQVLLEKLRISKRELELFVQCTNLIVRGFKLRIKAESSIRNQKSSWNRPIPGTLPQNLLRLREKSFQ